MKKECVGKCPRISGSPWACLRFALAALFFVMVLPIGLIAEEYKIVPKQDPDVPNGKFGAVQGTVGSQGEKFIVENLNMLQPVEIMLFSKDADTDLTLQLCKFDWKKPERSGSTKGTGIQAFQIRTEGDLKIFVASAQGEKPYQLAVWVGDEMQPAMKSAFIPKDDFKKMKGGSFGSGSVLGSPVLWIIAVLLAAILAVLVIFLKRGKRT